MRKLIPRLDVSFPLKRQFLFWFGKQYLPQPNEFLLNSARSGIVVALQTILPNGGKVGVVAYNCDSVYNAVFQAGCQCVFLDITADFRIDIQENKNSHNDLDAIIVTNLFGIKNDIESIHKIWPSAAIIVDNAHGYRLHPEGDFTVYSINQGKYPALGPGGILVVNNNKYLGKISHVYETLSQKKSFLSQWKLFLLMQSKTFIYNPVIYGWVTQVMKQHLKPKSGKPEKFVIGIMPAGVSRIYNAWIKDKTEIEQSQKPFMDIVYTNNQDKTIDEYKNHGVEADVHFRNWTLWATHYGYSMGKCPVAERMLNEVVMVPNYYKSDPR